MRLKGVAWDFDGTLADSEPLWWRALVALMGEHGRGPTGELARLTVGLSHYETVKVACALSEEKAIDAGEQRLFDLMEGLMTEHGIVLRAPALKLIEGLMAADIPMALVTSSPRRIVARALSGALDRDVFDCIVTLDDVQRPKPDPQPYRLAAEWLGIAARDMAAIEDSETGAVSAERAEYAGVLVVASSPFRTGPRRIIRPTLDGLSALTLDGLVAAL